MKFLFGNNLEIPRSDKSVIYKEHMGDTFTLIEVDYSAVSKKLDISEEESLLIVDAVVKSIWRAKEWSVLRVSKAVK